MQLIPAAVIRKLYNRTSLRNADGGVRFSVKNRLSPATLKRVDRVVLNGDEIALAKVSMSVDGSAPIRLDALADGVDLEFALGTLLGFHLDIAPLHEGEHTLELAFSTEPFGTLKLEIKDGLKSSDHDADSIPRDVENDYSDEVIRARQAFVRERSDGDPKHLFEYSFDADETRGNIEHFTGVAQVPVGIAGPIHVRGQHADGEFYVPLATTEGTLVASYNRGMKVVAECGGVKCAVVGDNMQRAPVFIFADAQTARRFCDWIVEKDAEIKQVCAETDPFVRLKYVDYYLANKFAFLRFNFTTGDAAGMNMVGKATFAACNWILQNCNDIEIERFFLESNFATDKKASNINMMRTRGKRVTAEVLIRRQVLADIMDADTESLYAHYKVATIGSMLSGAINNGCHSANAITALFLATGQDVANVSESSAALLYSELTPEKDLYMSITLPSLIVATCGGGTGLPTQRESLELLGCYGPGKVMKFAEIVAGTVLAGEISLAAAISSLDWVSSHDQYGRNDPLAAAS
ncbi:MAG: hydroxymethylglutaryl-CoA reductase [Pseudomonadota bacterium]